jgi:hypothetical protein
MPSQSLLQLRAVILHPAPDRCVVDVETTLLQQLLNIAQRERIANRTAQRMMPGLVCRHLKIAGRVIISRLFRVTASNPESCNTSDQLVVPEDLHFNGWELSQPPPPPQQQLVTPRPPYRGYVLANVSKVTDRIEERSKLSAVRIVRGYVFPFYIACLRIAEPVDPKTGKVLERSDSR